MKTNKERRNQKSALPQNEVRKRFFILVAIALVLIGILVWLTLAVLRANDIEPFGEVAYLCYGEDIQTENDIMKMFDVVL